MIPFYLILDLERAAKAIEARANPELSEQFNPQVRLADPQFGDFQINGVLAYAKVLKLNPILLAQRIAQDLSDLKEFQGLFTFCVAGPGFINCRLETKGLLAYLNAYSSADALVKAAKRLRPEQRVVVDYSSPNTAKQMHVGHLRSMVIGESIQRILQFCGNQVVRDNHIGDWGTQFGILIMAIKKQGILLDEIEGDVIQVLEDLYKKGVSLTKEDSSFLETARKELVLLQQGDPQNTALWEKIKDLSYTAFQSIYDIFKVEFDVVLGESFYKDKVERVIQELKETGLAQESEGALVVFHPEHPRFKDQPFIILKADGASNYATTDLATALYRLEHFKAFVMVNVVDSRQQDHFEQLRLTVSKWFSAKGYPQVELMHVAFGTILGEDGKAIKTRSGEAIKLKDLVAEAIERAYKLVDQKSPHFTESQKAQIARVVGIGALRYADLSQNRTSDYIFSWDKLLSFDGNTAPYLLYAVARIHSIFKKVNLSPQGFTAEGPLEGLHEVELARKIVAFSSILLQTVMDLKPHFLCTYLYELAGIFSSFYNAQKVIVEEESTRHRRLFLCSQTLLVLETGLNLLGIETLTAM